MRILVTGAGGNIASGLIPKLISFGHEVVASDVIRLEIPGVASFHQLDIQHGFGLDRAALGCDLIVHTPAWHGIHWSAKTEADFWRLNVDGTFWAFQAAQAADIKKVLFLSSTAWYGHYDKYGFTKRMGEELCEYNLQRHGISYVSVRPNDLTPWGTDWVGRYGPRLLYGGVDREDVLTCIEAGVRWLEKQSDPQSLVVEALKANAFTESQVENWESDPIGTCETIFPGSRHLVEKYGIPISRKPSVVGPQPTWETVGYRPTRHFGTFLADLARVDAEGGEAAVRSVHCSY